MSSGWHDRQVLPGSQDAMDSHGKVPAEDVRHHCDIPLAQEESSPAEVWLL